MTLNRFFGFFFEYAFTIPVPVVNRWDQQSMRNSPEKLAGDKAGLVTAEQDFLQRINRDFTDYYKPLIPWINTLRREVFPSGHRWTEQDISLCDRMRAVLERAVRDPKVKGNWPEGNGGVG
jgi:hypothetical protein